MPKLRKAQMSMQFMAIISFLFIVFSAFLIGMAGRYKEIDESRDIILVKDLAFMIRGEISLAYRMHDGYNRNFTVPADLEGRNFSIIQNGYVLVVRTRNNIEHSLYIPSLVGNVTRGVNTIQKINNTVCVGVACNG